METIRALQQLAPALNDIMFFITNLGSERAYIVFLLVAYLAFDAKAGRLLGVALLSSFYLNFMLKGVIDTPRPFMLEPELSLGAQYDATGLGAGFPSGHAQGSATFWILAAAFVKRAWFWLLALLVITLISLSRLYFALHLPVDVIGGVAIGFLLSVAAWQLFRWTQATSTHNLASNNLVSKALVVGAGMLAPLLLHLTVPRLLSVPIPESDLLMGGLAAFISGPALYTHRARGAWWRRGLLALLGVLLVFGFLLGSSLLLPETLKRDALGGFLRYLALGYVGVLLTPWLGSVLRIVPRSTFAETSAPYSAPHETSEA